MSKTKRLGCMIGVLVLAASVSLGVRPGGAGGEHQTEPCLFLQKSVLGSGGSPGAADAWIMNGTLGQIASSGEDPDAAAPLHTGFWVSIPGGAATLYGLCELRAGDYTCQSFPNPFRLSTTIAYRLSRECAVDITVFDVHGRKVRTVVAATQEPGSYTAVWDGCDESGRESSPGIYFYRLDADNQRTVRKMVLAR